MATTPIPISSLETPSTTSDVGTSVSASPSPSYPLSRPLERPKKSPVWDYFLYDVTTDKSICQMEQLDSQSICEKSVAGKFTTNLKKHLKLAHPSDFDDVVKKEEEVKKQKMEKESAKRAASLKNLHQFTLKESLAKLNPYPKDSVRYKLITRKLAIFTGSPMLLIELWTTWYFEICFMQWMIATKYLEVVSRGS